MIDVDAVFYPIDIVCDANIVIWVDAFVVHVTVEPSGSKACVIKNSTVSRHLNVQGVSYTNTNSAQVATQVPVTSERQDTKGSSGNIQTIGPIVSNENPDSVPKSNEKSGRASESHESKMLTVSEPAAVKKKEENSDTVRKPKEPERLRDIDDEVSDRQKKKSREERGKTRREYP